MIQRAPPPRETPPPPPREAPPPYKEPPHIILERRAEMAEVTTGSLAQGEQNILLLYDWGHSGFWLMCVFVCILIIIIRPSLNNASILII